MADTIFIAYAHEDEKRASQVISHLRVLEIGNETLEVWSDNRITAGAPWKSQIEKAIARATVVILLISSDFLTSAFIRDVELPKILKRYHRDNLVVIPVLVRPCAWGTVNWLSRLELRPQRGRSLADGKAEAALAELAMEVSTLIGADKGKSPSAATVLPVGNLALPCFFPSVSGAAKSSLPPLTHLEILLRSQHPSFLASVYDFETASPKDRQRMTDIVSEAGQRAIVILDSGIYERKWLRDASWTQKRYHNAVKQTPCQFAFSYDHQSTSKGIKETAATIAKGMTRDRAATGLEMIVPIIHPLTQKPPGQSLPKLCVAVTKESRAPIIAVTERELGRGILEGATTMLAIRRELTKAGLFPAIHVLGTGNPLSILVYTFCGADSFDGLDWCQTAVDYKTHRLYHSQQLDFFSDQSVFADEKTLEYDVRLLSHNLNFYREWMRTLVEQREAGRLAKLVSKTLPLKFGDKLLALVGDT